MKLEVTKEAAAWYISEMNLKSGDYVQFVVKIYGGIPTPHKSYYLGLSVGKEGTIAIKDEVEGITFYFDDRDAWFLENYDLAVVRKDDDVDYIFT
ncbi:HesB/YadR/YfhF family protein [Neobacillus vireti]|uniref:HesB/YadR/YfhF family protein n=1 Tax=Neobacillus vireti TaxID=220686 RepID=UPI0030006172